ncbi:hypothetical protein MPC1_9440002 [Methylocella tundrae]|uniref:Uncharacterized protein n=1 Tax=Methylocella tundrae TaxID=227605 RepID=A0A4U8YUL4_METTU|nr:protein of unknown function [Methylocella tundrae]VTZ28526.1 hypothetical protein MPC1_9440002 [Methylocella tundrae]
MKVLWIIRGLDSGVRLKKAEGHVGKISDHFGHRFIRRGNDLRQAHLRADFPARRHQRGLYRGRRLSPL